MDAGKRKGLVLSINALKVGPPITCLEQLSDGLILYKCHLACLAAIRQMKGEQDVHLLSPQDRYAAIKSHLEHIYNLDYEQVINTSEINTRRNETEIAKVLLLLLCVPVLTAVDNPSVSRDCQALYDPMFNSDQSLQKEIIAMFEFVVRWRNSGKPFDANFSVLSNKQTEGPTAMDTCTTPTGSAADNFPQSNVEVFSNSPLQTGRASAGAASLREYMSPLLSGNNSTSSSPLQLEHLSINSPRAAKRMMAKENHLKRKAEGIVRQKNMEMRKLTRELHTEKDRREDLEIDVAEKNKEIEDRDHRIRELGHQIQVNDELREENERLKLLTEQKDHALARMTTKVEECQRLKDESKEYEQENHRLYQELEQLHGKLKKSESEVRECEHLRSTARDYEGRVRELEAALNRRGSEVLILSEAKHCIQEQLTSAQEMNKIQKERYEDLLQQAADLGSVPGESLGFITQKRVGELEEELRQRQQLEHDLRVQVETLCENIQSLSSSNGKLSEDKSVSETRLEKLVAEKNSLLLEKQTSDQTLECVRLESSRSAIEQKTHFEEVITSLKKEYAAVVAENTENHSNQLQKLQEEHTEQLLLKDSENATVANHLEKCLVLSRQETEERLSSFTKQKDTEILNMSEISKREISQLMVQLAEQRKSLQQASHTMSEMETSFHRKIADAKSKHSQLLHELETEGTNKEARLVEECTLRCGELQQQIEASTLELSSVQNLLEKEKTAKCEIKEQAGSLSTEVEIFHEKIQRLSSVNSKLSEDKSMLETQLQELVAEKDSVMLEKVAFQDELECFKLESSLKAEKLKLQFDENIAILEKEHTAKMAEKIECLMLKSNRKTFEQKTQFEEIMATSQEYADKMTEKIEKFSCQIQQLQQEHTQQLLLKDSEHKNAVDCHETLQMQTRQEIVEKLSEISLLNSKLAEQTEKLEQTSHETQEMKTGFQREISEAKSKHSQLLHELETEGTNKEARLVEECTLRCGELQQQIEASTLELSSVQNLLEKEKTAKCEIKEQAGSLSTEVEIFHEKIQRLSSVNSKLSEDKSMLETQLQELVAEKDSVMLEKVAFQDELECFKLESSLKAEKLKLQFDENIAILEKEHTAKMAEKIECLMLKSNRKAFEQKTQFEEIMETSQECADKMTEKIEKFSCRIQQLQHEHTQQLLLKDSEHKNAVDCHETLQMQTRQEIVEKLSEISLLNSKLAEQTEKLEQTSHEMQEMKTGFQREISEAKSKHSQLLRELETEGTNKEARLVEECTLRCGELQQQIEASTLELRSVQNLLEKEKTEKCEIKEQAGSLSTEVEILHEKIQSLSSVNSKLSEDKSMLETQLQELVAEKDSLMLEKVSFQDELECFKLESSLKAEEQRLLFEENIAILEKEHAEKMECLTLELNRKAFEQKTQFAEIMATSEKEYAAKIAEKIENCTCEIQQLQQEHAQQLLSKDSEHKHLVDYLETFQIETRHKMEGKLSEISLLNSKLAEQTKNLELTFQKMREMKTGFQREIAEAKSKQSQLLHELETESTDKESCLVEEYTFRCAELQQQIEASTLEVNSVKSLLEKEKTEKCEIQEQADSLSADVNDLFEQMQQSKNGFQKQLAEVQSEHEKIVVSLKDASKAEIEERESIWISERRRHQAIMQETLNKHEEMLRQCQSEHKSKTSEAQATHLKELEALRESFDVQLLQAKQAAEVSHKQCIQQMDRDFVAKESNLAGGYARMSEEAKEKQVMMEERLTRHSDLIDGLQAQIEAEMSNKTWLQADYERRLEETQQNWQAERERYANEISAIKENNDELQSLHDSVIAELQEKSQEQNQMRQLLEDGEKQISELEMKISHQKQKYEEKLQEIVSSMTEKCNGFVTKYEERKSKMEAEREELLAEYESRLETQHLSDKAQCDALEQRLSHAACVIDQQRLAYENCLQNIQARDGELQTVRQELVQEKQKYEQRIHHMADEINKLITDQASLQGEVHSSTSKILHLEELCQTQEQQIHQNLENSIKVANTQNREMKQAGEFNNMLKRQLEEKTQTMKYQTESFQQQIQDMQHKSHQTETEMEQAKQSHACNETELKEKITALNDAVFKENEQVKLRDDEIARLQQQMEKCREKFEYLQSRLPPLQVKLQEEENNNKKLNHEVRSLEVQLSHAEAQVRKYREELDKQSAALLGDQPSFLLHNRASSSDGSMLDDSLESKNQSDEAQFIRPQNPEKPESSYFLRPRTQSNPESPCYRTRHRSAGDVSHRSDGIAAISLASSTPYGKTFTVTESDQSTYKSGASQSLRSLNTSIISTASTDSTRSANVPRSAMGMFTCEDEEDIQYEWNRLGELQRRNTLCLPHMRSCYPVETQTANPRDLSDHNVREGSMSDNPTLTSQASRTRKRRSDESTENHSAAKLTDSRKTARHGPLYQKPGLPTPVANDNRRQRRMSAERLTPRRSERRRSQSANTPNTENRENEEHVLPVEQRRESIAFSINNTPKSQRRGMKRQTGFVQKPGGGGASSAAQTNPTYRKPLAIRNYLQTGL